MKTAHLWVTIFVGILAVSGCSKKPEAKPYDIQGVQVDIPKLTAAFSTADPALTKQVGDAASTLRYNMYDKALEQLTQVAANPNLTETQKKEINDVMGQLKQLIDKNPPPAK